MPKKKSKRRHQISKEPGQRWIIHTLQIYTVCIKCKTRTAEKPYINAAFGWRFLNAQQAKL